MDADCIENGKPEDSQSCAFALALKRHIKDGQHFTVRHMSVCYGVPNRPGSVMVMHEDDDLEDFIEIFDAGGEVEPGMYPVDIPDQFLKELTI